MSMMNPYLPGTSVHLLIIPSICMIILSVQSAFIFPHESYKPLEEAWEVVCARGQQMVPVKDQIVSTLGFVNRVSQLLCHKMKAAIYNIYMSRRGCVPISIISKTGWSWICPSGCYLLIPDLHQHSLFYRWGNWGPIIDVIWLRSYS